MAKKANVKELRSRLMQLQKEIQIQEKEELARVGSIVQTWHKKQFKNFDLEAFKKEVIPILDGI